jgi:hypothetical protein
MDVSRLDPDPSEDISSFEVLDVLLCGLKAYVAWTWTSFMEA